MEIKVNDRDKLYLISSIVGFIAFFLPWVGGGFIGQHSVVMTLLNYGSEMVQDKSWIFNPAYLLNLVFYYFFI